MDGPFSGRVALITGASGRRWHAGWPPAGRTGARLGRPGQAAQALAAEITSAGGTAPAIGAGLRRPQAPC